MTAKHTPLPELKAKFHRTVPPGVSMYVLYDGRGPANVTLGLGHESPVTAEMIASRFNAYPVLVEALKEIIAYEERGGMLTYINADVARKTLAKAGVK